MNEALQVRLTEIQQLLHFVAVQWPELRPQLAGQLARRCNRCILSERYTSISDELCDVCVEAEAGAGGRSGESQRRDRSGMEQQLSALLAEHQGRGSGHYDALVLFSGGKDSAFLLSRLRSEFPTLRLLAATIDNGFFSPIAMANCRQILERLPGVDHVFYKPEANLYVKTFRHAFTHLNEGGCYTTVDRMDGDLAFDIGRNLAASLNIPLMITGLSPGQVERILGLRSFETLAEAERQRRTHCAGFELQSLYTAEECRKYWWDGTGWPAERIPRVLFPFYAWEYDEDFIRQEVVRLGLIRGGHDNPLATNNDTIPVMLAVDNCLLGYSGFEPEFAELVRTGKADREFWLALFQTVEYLSRRGEFMPASIAQTLDRLSLTHPDVGLPQPAAGR